MPSDDTDQKETHRLGTINRWDVPEGDWAAKHDWTRYRGPAPWPVPDGWVFKDPEEGGWWAYFGDAGVGHHTDDSILEALQDDESVADPYDAMDELRDQHGEYAHLSVETANPDEVSLRNPEDERLEWTLDIDEAEVFTCVEPDRTDLMGAVATALAAYHEDELESRIDEIMPSSGKRPDDERAEETIEQRKEHNQSLGDFS